MWFRSTRSRPWRCRERPSPFALDGPLNVRAAPELSQGSLLDRLIGGSEGARGGSLSWSDLREGLRRDLESLLNTRRRFISTPPELEHLDDSLLNYGLTDMTNQGASSPEFREDFVAHVEEVLQRLEPRITAFEVILLENPDPLDRILRFRIVGLVALGDEKQELQFDSHIDPVKAGIVVRE